MTKETINSKPDTSSKNSSQRLSIDWELYSEYLNDADLSEEEKRELIETLWSIVISFVDLGIGLHPLQRVGAEQADNRNNDLSQFIASDTAKMLGLDNSPNKQNKQAVAHSDELLLQEES